jgi:hypothetical protein
MVTNVRKYTSSVSGRIAEYTSIHPKLDACDTMKQTSALEFEYSEISTHEARTWQYGFVLSF